MKEAAFTAKLLKALRSHAALHDAVIWKHSDFYTKGVPDFSVTLNSYTTWWECKIKPNKTTKLQSWFLAKLGACAFIISASNDGKWVEIFSAFEGCGTSFNSSIEEIVKRCGHA